MTNQINRIADQNISVDLHHPTVLYQTPNHTIYWLGISQEAVFRCNAYLIASGNEFILVDPGGKTSFPIILERVTQIVSPKKVTGMILCHQDPDVAASMENWLAVNPEMSVISSPRIHVLLPHYGTDHYQQYDTEKAPRLPLPANGELIFLPAPFLHSPGAFATFDTKSGFLFSGDIWASLDTNMQLTVSSFKEHIPKLDLFHKEYMASNIAARGFIQTLSQLDIQAILPQHGSLINSEHVQHAFAYLEALQSGTDLFYTNLTDPPLSGCRHALYDEEPANIIGTPSEPFAEKEYSEKQQSSLLTNQKQHQVHSRQTEELLHQVQRIANIRDKALHNLKKTETQLRASQERFCMLLQAAGEGIFGFNKEGVATFANPAALAMLGYEEQEFVGKKVHSLIHHTHTDGTIYHEDTCQMLSPLIDGKLHRITDEVLWRKDGSSFAVEYTTTLLQSESNSQIDGVVIIFSDTSEKQQLLGDLEYRADHDALTGLINRQKINTLLHEECHRSVRYMTPLSIVLYDIDKFKNINDTYGHQQGDKIIQEVTRQIDSLLRTEDKHGRWGGEEFLIFLPQTKLSGGVALAERCRKAVCENIICCKKTPISISIGVVQFIPGEKQATLFQRADKLLYQAKAKGRNRVEHG